MNNGISTKLKQLRNKNHYTQEYVAKSINKSIRTYQKYESGEITPSIETLKDLAEVFKVGTTIFMEPDNYWEDENGIGHTEPMYNFDKNTSGIKKPDGWDKITKTWDRFGALGFDIQPTALDYDDDHNPIDPTYELIEKETNTKYILTEKQFNSLSEKIISFTKFQIQEELKKNSDNN